MNKHFHTIFFAPLYVCLFTVFNTQAEPVRLHTRLPQSNDLFTPYSRTAAKVASGLAVTAGISYIAGNYVKDGSGSQFYNGQYAWGYSQALQMSALCLTITPLLNQESGDQFFRFGTRAPIIAATAIVLAHPFTQKVAAHTPLLGDHISTYKKDGESKCGTECHGICNRCFIPKTLLVVGLYKIIDPAIDKIGSAIGKKFGFIKEDNNE